MRVQAVVPAAGLSTRFPGNKLLEPVAGKPLIARTVGLLVEQELIEKVVVVTGFMREGVESAISRHFGEQLSEGRVVLAYNPRFAEGGMSSSIRVGLLYVDETADVLVMPGDVGCVKKRTVGLVVREHVESGSLITVASYAGRLGHPIIFSSRMRPELESISEETRGLKRLVSSFYDKIRVVETGDPGVILDADYPESAKKCEELLREEG